MQFKKDRHPLAYLYYQTPAICPSANYNFCFRKFSNTRFNIWGDKASTATLNAYLTTPPHLAWHIIPLLYMDIYHSQPSSPEQIKTLPLSLVETAFSDTKFCFSLHPTQERYKHFLPCLSFQQIIQHVSHCTSHSSVCLSLCVWGAGDHWRSACNRKLLIFLDHPCKVTSAFHQSLFPAVPAHLLATEITRHPAHSTDLYHSQYYDYGYLYPCSAIYISPNPNLILLPLRISNPTQSYCTEGDTSATP